MEYILAVFRSRSETLYFANLLKNWGVLTSIVNTPRGVGQSCSISVKFLPQDLEKAKTLLLNKSFQGFAGFYIVTIRNGMVRDVNTI